MRRFSRALRRVDRRLEVREPERSRILLELAGDLEDLYRAYREQGSGEEEARRRAEAWLVPDDGSLEGLRRLHQPRLAGLASSLSEVARNRLEATALTVLALAAAAGGLAGLGTTPLLGPPGPAAVAVLVLGSLGIVLAARRAAWLLLSRDGGPPAPESLPGLVASAAGSAGVGALGGCLELERGLASAGAGGEDPANLVTVPWEAVGAAAGTAALGLVVTLCLALAWFWLVARVRTIRRARSELVDLVPTLEARTSRGG